MTKKEQYEVSQQTLQIYSGILLHNQTFSSGNDEKIKYNFDCPQFSTLKQKYELEKIAKQGTEFDKAKRLLHYLAPRLAHSGWYDNHIPCNALDLLEYSLNNPEHGINCLNKSKILQECCLAIGIYARRVAIMPYSPYDFDNHVVTEIFDKQLNKWIMLDPTTDGLFVDNDGTPLSILDIREKFANADFVTFVQSTDKLQNLKSLKEKHVEINSYICKNLFYFNIDQVSTFGTTSDYLTFVPEHYSIKENVIANIKFRINNLPDEHKEFIPQLKKDLELKKTYDEPTRTNISSMIEPPTI